MNKDSTPITAFLPFFLEMIQLLVAETNKHYLDLLDSDGRCAQLPDMTEQEMNIFLTIIIQMGHNVRDTEMLLVNNRTNYIHHFTAIQRNKTSSFTY